jgi:hypothetical protein
LPKGVTAEDVAFFVGRVVEGVGGAPDVTLGAVVKIVAPVAGIVAVLHLPSIAATGVAAAGEQRSETLKEELARQGMLRNLKELEEGWKELIPLLRQLASAIHED